MDPTAFATLVRSLAPPETRRRLLTRLTALLPVAGLGTMLEGAEARGRSHGRHRGHHPGKGKKNRKGKRNGGKGSRAGSCDVCNTPGDCRHTSIQEAHDAANAGDTLTLCDGTYTENVTLSKPLTLASRQGDKVVLQGNGSGSIVTVQPGATTTFKNMALRGTGSGSVVTIQPGVTTTLTKVFISGGMGTV